HRRLVEVGGPPPCARELTRVEQRAPTERSRRVDDVSVRTDHLGVALAVLDEPARRQRAPGGGDGREVLGPHAELAIERGREVRAEPEVEKERRAGEDD